MLLAIDGIDLNPVDSEGRTPLLWAVRLEFKEIVEMLLATEGIDLNPVDGLFGRTLLLWAVKLESKEIVEILLAMDGIDLSLVDIVNKTPLSWAAEHGNKEIERMLLARDGIDLNNAKREYGWTDTILEMMRSSFQSVIYLNILLIYSRVPNLLKKVPSRI
jgi:ankyrin repeat protein